MFRALFVIAVAVLCMSGCRPWQQAEQVLHTADSLDAQGVIYYDTAAFQSVILTYDRPVVRCLKHSDLGKAYYYLGRNYEDYHQRYLSAARCYTRSDQCHMSDPIMRGRVNFAISNICRMGDEDSLAVEYGQYATNLYLQNKDTTLYIHGLLSLAQIHRNIKNNHIADSLLQSVAHYPLDESCRQRLAEQRGFYYYFLHEYDSALLYIRDAIRLQKSEKTIWYDYHLLMLTHYRLTNLDSAVYYAERIMDECPDIYVLEENACYVLMEQYEKNNDANALAYYAHLRADLQKESDLQKEECRKGVEYIKQYYAHQSGIGKRVLLIVFTIVFAIGILFFMAYTYNKRLTRARKEAFHRVQEMNQHHVKIIEKLEKQLDLFAEYMEQHDEVWTDDAAFLNTINLYLWNMADTLRASYPLSVQDIKICVMTLLNMSRKEMAAKLFRAESSIPQMRARVAQKAGVSTQELRDFLIKQLTD